MQSYEEVSEPSIKLFSQSTDNIVSFTAFIWARRGEGRTLYAYQILKQT